MSVENILILSILVGAIILFVSEKLRVDVVAMIVLAALVLTGLINIDEAFSGFASPAVITVWAVFIVSGGLTRSGVADAIARFIVRIAGENSARLTVIIMVGVGLMSAFMNNIGAVAILLPAVVSVARETKTPPSKLLIPLAWASLMGNGVNHYTTAVELREGTLYVSLSSSVLREELSLGKSKIVELLNEELGREVVSKIVLR